MGSRNRREGQRVEERIHETTMTTGMGSEQGEEEDMAEQRPILHCTDHGTDLSILLDVRKHVAPQVVMVEH